MGPENMGLYILQGTTLTLPYRISVHAETPENYDEYLEFIDLYERVRVLIIESNELTNLPANVRKFHRLERLEIRGSYWCNLTVDNMPSIHYLSLIGVRNINIEFFDRLTELSSLRTCEVLEGHLTLLPDWESTSVESIIIYLENYNNFLTIRLAAPNSPELWKLIPALRIDKSRCFIAFEPHYDQSYLGVVVVNRELRKA